MRHRLALDIELQAWLSATAPGQAVAGGPGGGGSGSGGTSSNAGIGFAEGC